MTLLSPFKRSFNAKRGVLSRVSFITLLSSLSALPMQANAITLHDTIEDAINHNPEYLSEVKEYRSIEAEVSGAYSTYKPKVDINLGIGYEGINRESVSTNPQSEFDGTGLTRKEGSIKITQNLFEGFGGTREIDRLQYKLGAQAYKTEAQANTIALAMTEAYLELQQEEDLLSLSQDNLDTHKKILDQIQQRFEAGLGNQVEVNQAKARHALAGSTYESTQQNYHDTLAKFRRVLGRDPNTSLMTPQFTANLPKTLEEATAIAMIDHPTLRAANGDIAEAKLLHMASDQDFWPTLDLEIEKTFDADVSGSEGKNEFFQIMLRMKYNLYAGGTASANRIKTLSSYRQATDIRNNTRRQIIEDLRYAWNAKKYVAQRLIYINQHIKLTHDTLAGYRKQFSLGRRSLLDLLNTENEYSSALRTLITSETEYQTANYRILAATGHLLEKLNIKYSSIQPGGPSE